MKQPIVIIAGVLKHSETANFTSNWFTFSSPEVKLNLLNSLNTILLAKDSFLPSIVTLKVKDKKHVKYFVNLTLNEKVLEQYKNIVKPFADQNYLVVFSIIKKKWIKIKFDNIIGYDVKFFVAKKSDEYYKVVPHAHAIRKS